MKSAGLSKVSKETRGWKLLADRSNKIVERGIVALLTAVVEEMTAAVSVSAWGSLAAATSSYAPETESTSALALRWRPTLYAWGAEEGSHLGAEQAMHYERRCPWATGSCWQEVIVRHSRGCKDGGTLKSDRKPSYWSGYGTLLRSWVHRLAEAGETQVGYTTARERRKMSSDDGCN